MLGAQLLLLCNCDEANEIPCSPADYISGAICVATRKMIAGLPVENKRPAQTIQRDFLCGQQARAARRAPGSRGMPAGTPWLTQRTA